MNLLGMESNPRLMEKTYDVDIHKERTKTRLAGAKWRRFISQNNITPDVHLFFSMGSPGPKINVVYFEEAIHFGEGSDEESGDEESGDEEGSGEEGGDEEGGEEDHPIDSAIFSQRCHLTADEESYLPSQNNIFPVEKLLNENKNRGQSPSLNIMFPREIGRAHV